MNKYFIAVVAVILCLSKFSTGAFAIEDIHKINLQQALDIAVENNIDLKAARLNVEIAKNKIKSANRLQNPEFNMFYNIGTAGRSEPQQLGFSELLEIGNRSPRKNLAKSNLELENENLRYTKFNLKMDVREAYINLIAEKSVLDTLEQQAKLQEELYEIVKKKVKSQKAPEMDELQAEIALNQMMTQVNTAKITVRNALVYFNKIINPSSDVSYDTQDNIFLEENNFDELLTPDPNDIMPEFEEIKEHALEHRYDIKIAKQQIDIAKKNLTLISHQRLPDIEVVGGYTYQSRAQTDTVFKSGAYAGANIVNLPVFYRYKPEINNAKLELQQANLKYVSTVNKAMKDVDAAYAKFLTARTNLNYYEKNILKSSDKLIRASIKNYETGKSDLTALIVMKQSYKSIIVGYTYALAEYYNSWTNFLREVNDESFDLYEDQDDL